MYKFKNELGFISKIDLFLENYHPCKAKVRPTVQTSVQHTIQFIPHLLFPNTNENTLLATAVILKGTVRHGNTKTKEIERNKTSELHCTVGFFDKERNSDLYATRKN